MFKTVFRSFASAPLQARIAVTGGGGQISYSLLFRIASGQLLGPNCLIDLNIIDLPVMQNALKGIEMELQDCAFPLLRSITLTDSLSVGFKDIDYAFLVGSKPRGPGQERAELLKYNAEIFVETGKALSDNAKRNAKVVVVANPCNTVALICAANAKGMAKENFSAMSRLDENRGKMQLALKFDTSINDVKSFYVWGNHSPTMYPDISTTTIKGKPAKQLVDQAWYQNEFVPTIAKRGYTLIEVRKASSAASAANSAIFHLRDWVLGSKDIVSMAVLSDGSYDIPKDLMFSFPLKVKGDGTYQIVQNLQIDEFGRKKLQITTEDLLKERSEIEAML